MKTLTEISKAVYDNATAKGFHPEGESEQLSVEIMCNNLHDEISELHEAWRNNTLHSQCDKPIILTYAEEEMADIIIRILDNCITLGVDIERAVNIKHEYNCTREFKHGGKKS